MNTHRITLLAGFLAPLTLLAPLTSAADTQRAASGMVVAEHWLASEVGRDVLAAGGNAVDAAVATGFALAVTHPAAGNIGGGGFMVIRFPDGSSTAIDFRETAPAAAHPQMWLDEATGDYSSRTHHYSHKAVGVPGTVAGFDKAHRLYGSAHWHELVSPATHLAATGFTLSENLAASLSHFVERFAHYNATVAQYSQGGTPYAAGDTLRQPDLARTLHHIQTARRDGFYTGETARLIVEEMERGGGLIALEDLAQYQARERQPIHGTYRGYEVLSMPPPSSGGVAIVTMLNILEAYDLTRMGHNSATYIHHLAEVMRRAFRDRAQWLADVDLVDVPIHRLTSKRHAAELRRDIDPDHASVSAATDLSMTDESPETTHYSVVDADGMAVAVTYTLEAGYGSGIVVPGGGFLLNNEMGDFNAAPGLTNETGLIGTTPNLARPGQRMLSSMSPTILSRGGELVAVLGSPGGRTIINTVLQLILNLVDFEMTIDDAVSAPRMHHQWLPDRIRLEANRIDDEIVETLEQLGHAVHIRGRQGSAHSIGIDARTGQRIGAADPRSRDAGARGH
ncbi:MAG: gamma-glutamyltransferase [Gemmatimonadetes bacterium]|jgi:gamma-glutamyltranspeptidase / glutathione hydrolase|nr:gamma-glutamyltransferase [Gemmatimonadota bacterium]MBT6150067.1 gamma-glutamyltransferase [Gemmatimonadota bacterium]MBT7861061.1 gamma-glutamyltransferase [Gemmatimonadota bacterium]